MEDTKDVTMTNLQKLIKRIYILVLALLISFWCVIGVGSVKLFKLSNDLKASQKQLKEITKTVEIIDVDDLNDTISSLNKTAKKLKSLLGK